MRSSRRGFLGALTGVAAAAATGVSAATSQGDFFRCPSCKGDEFFEAKIVIEDEPMVACKNCRTLSLAPAGYVAPLSPKQLEEGKGNKLAFRELRNRPGITYDPTKSHQIYAEDLTAIHSALSNMSASINTDTVIIGGSKT